jgi:predicted transcriptional regulator
MKKIVKAWKDSQVDLLKKFYGSIPMDELALKLGKTKSSIYSKVHYLRNRGWTFK